MSEKDKPYLVFSDFIHQNKNLIKESIKNNKLIYVELFIKENRKTAYAPKCIEQMEKNSSVGIRFFSINAKDGSVNKAPTDLDEFYNDLYKSIMCKRILYPKKERIKVSFIDQRFRWDVTVNTLDDFCVRISNRPRIII